MAAVVSLYVHDTRRMLLKPAEGKFVIPTTAVAAARCWTITPPANTAQWNLWYGVRATAQLQAAEFGLEVALNQILLLQAPQLNEDRVQHYHCRVRWPDMLPLPVQGSERRQ